MKRNVIHKYVEREIDYGILAVSIYNKLKEDKSSENEATAIKDNELYGMQES